MASDVPLPLRSRGTGGVLQPALSRHPPTSLSPSHSFPHSLPPLPSFVLRLPGATAGCKFPRHSFSLALLFGKKGGTDPPAAPEVQTDAPGSILPCCSSPGRGSPLAPPFLTPLIPIKLMSCQGSRGESKHVVKKWSGSQVIKCIN